jgi:hypothetical protein
LEIEGGVISSLMQQAIPARAGGDYAMTSHSTMPDQPQPATETAVHLFDNWFDPIEAVLRDRAREFLQAMLEGELDEVLERSRYACPSRKSYPRVVMMQSSQDWYCGDGPGSLNSSS